MNQMLEEREVKQTPKTYEMNTQCIIWITIIT